MKTLLRNVLVTGALALGATALMAQQASHDWVDQLYKAKIGRAPFAEAQQRAEQAKTVYREEATPQVMPANTWFEDRWRAKYGRSSPLEEARQREERTNTVYREEVAPKSVMPANTWLNDFWKAKLGRPFPGNENK